MHGSRPLAALGLVAALAPACSDPELDPCDHRVCNIQDRACVEQVARTMACRLELEDLTIPDVRMATVAELAAEIEATPDPATPEQIRDVTDYYRGEALIGLMTDQYQYGDDRTAFLDWAIAYYSSDTKDVTVITDNLGDDVPRAYFVLVHELVHAYQDSKRDILGLLDAHATTFDRYLGLRAMLEGEAEHHESIADVEIAGLDPDAVLWNDYYGDYQAWALERAAESSQPSLDVFAYFPYAFGGEVVVDAWQAGGNEDVEPLFSNPPDSVRQVMAGYAAWPGSQQNGDARLAPHAAPVMPARYEYLGGGHESVWLLNALLQRTAGTMWAWAPALASVSAEYLSIFRDDDSGHLVALWRIQTSDVDGLVGQLTIPQSQWSLEAGSHLVTFVDDDLLLVATDGADAAEVVAEIQGWQTVEAVNDDGDGTSGEAPRPGFGPHLGPHGSPFGPHRHARRTPA